MTKQITAVFENGMLRPEHPVDLQEGERLQLIVVTRNWNRQTATPPNVLGGNCSLAIEGEPGSFRAPITIAFCIPGPDRFR